MKMVRNLRRVTLVPLVLVCLWGACLSEANAEDGFDVYLFGRNLRSYEDTNWLKVVAGAAASLVVHELGHALALELTGKSWELRATLPSGLAVHTEDHLEGSEFRTLGRAGFVLQSLIGFGLTSFETTKRSDFTKGWVGMNALQISSYRSRRHDIADDFATIEKGGGDGDLEFAVLSLLSVNNIMRLGSDPKASFTKSYYSPGSETDDSIRPFHRSTGVLALETDLYEARLLLLKMKRPRSLPPDTYAYISSPWEKILLANRDISN